MTTDTANDAEREAKYFHQTNFSLRSTVDDSELRATDGGMKLFDTSSSTITARASNEGPDTD